MSRRIPKHLHGKSGPKPRAARYVIVEAGTARQLHPGHFRNYGEAETLALSLGGVVSTTHWLAKKHHL
jgi:hypothetical protein